MSSAEGFKLLHGGEASKRGYTLAERLALADAEFIEAKNKLDALKVEFRESNDYGTTEEAGVTITVGHNPQFNKTLAVELFGDKVKEFIATPAAAKRALGSDDLSKLYFEGEKKISVKRNV